jgi:hypothetical protein
VNKKEALKIVLDLARKYVLARYWNSLEKVEKTGKGKVVEAAPKESEALEIITKEVGEELDGQKTLEGM